MLEDYLEKLVFLQVKEQGALCEQREQTYQRIPYEMEKTLYTYIYSGQPEETKAIYQTMLMHEPSLRLPIAGTSGDTLRQLKYAVVSAIAIACRAALEGGAVEAVAYSINDDAILDIDEKDNIAEVLSIEKRTLVKYAELVRDSKNNRLFSPDVRRCINYLIVHAHRTVTLDDLSECSALSKEYLAKLFKKEVGMSFVDYHLHLRIEEAKILLHKGSMCVDVANTLGFSTQSYFIKQFKKVTGISPKQFTDTIAQNSAVNERRS